MGPTPNVQRRIRETAATLTWLFAAPTLRSRQRRGSQVVRSGSAKPLFAGSIPAPASSSRADLLRNRDFVRRSDSIDSLAAASSPLRASSMSLGSRRLQFRPRLSPTSCAISAGANFAPVRCLALAVWNFSTALALSHGHGNASAHFSPGRGLRQGHAAARKAVAGRALSPRRHSPRRAIFAETSACCCRPRARRSGTWPARAVRPHRLSRHGKSPEAFLGTEPALFSIQPVRVAKLPAVRPGPRARARRWPSPK